MCLMDLNIAMEHIIVCIVCIPIGAEYVNNSIITIQWIHYYFRSTYGHLIIYCMFNLIAYKRDVKIYFSKYTNDDA